MAFRLAVDCLGFENHPREAIDAVLEYWSYHQELEFILVADEKTFDGRDDLPKNITKQLASSCIDMTDTPLTARRKVNNSMQKAINLVRDGAADVVISAGSSAVYASLTYDGFGKIHKDVKSAFMSYVPTANNDWFYFLDVGANKNFTGKELYFLGLMADIFVKKTTNKISPRIALLNIGTEINKGFDYHQEGYQLLNEDKHLNFTGFIEPRFLLDGVCDILVADGYSGNLVLKSMEGTFKTIARLLKQGYKRNPLAGLFSLGILKRIAKRFDYKNNAGAVVIGLNKLALKTHGSADKQQFLSTIRLAHTSLKSDLINAIKSSLDNYEK